MTAPFKGGKKWVHSRMHLEKSERQKEAKTSLALPGAHHVAYPPAGSGHSANDGP